MNIKKLTLNNMKILETIIFICIGFLIGFIYNEIAIPKPIMSERKELCESQGGKYNYYWGSYQKAYIEECKRIPGFIDLDQ